MLNTTHTAAMVMAGPVALYASSPMHGLDQASMASVNRCTNAVLINTPVPKWRHTNNVSRAHLLFPPFAVRVDGRVV